MAKKRKSVKRKQKRSMPARTFVKVRLSFEPGTEPEPYRGRTPSGSIRLSKEKPELIATAVDKKYLGLIKGKIQMPSNHMHPTFKQGAWVGIWKSSFSHILYWGYPYLIFDKKLQGRICRLFPGETKETVIFKFDNKRYKPREYKVSDLRGIFQIYS